MGGTGKEVERRRRVLDHAQQAGNVAKTCRYFGIGRASFYRWRQEYLKRGEPGLVPRKPGPKSHPNRTPDAVVEKVLHLRQTYHLGPIRIVWYLARYHISNQTSHSPLPGSALILRECPIPTPPAKRPSRKWNSRY